MSHKKTLFTFVAVCAVVLVSLATAPPAFAGSEQTLYSFCSTGGSSCTDGILPTGGVIFDAAGNLYGTVGGGGASGWGAVFELTPNGGKWIYQALYNFCPNSGCSDGSYPATGVIFDTAGNLYGTTFSGGAYGAGTVFELTPNHGTWTEKVLHSFTGGNDGSGPEAGLVIDGNGNLYGTTFFGGAYHGGVVFELIPNNGTWTEKALHWFKENGKGGSNSYSSLVLDKSGNVYGTTPFGGIYGYGTVFELLPGNGFWTEKVLHSFNVKSRGGYQSTAGVILDSSGNIYGTTSGGGTYNGGTAFELTPSNGIWSLNVLVAFKPGRFGPVGPSGLILDTSGNLYGTTYNGGAYARGGVFELTPNNGTWMEKLLFSFNPSDGLLSPDSGLILDRDGNLYGTTEFGGAHDDGAVFRLRHKPQLASRAGGIRRERIGDRESQKEEYKNGKQEELNSVRRNIHRGFRLPEHRISSLCGLGEGVVQLLPSQGGALSRRDVSLYRSDF
jgi:uncharacterized repeat protein (TIGR03803 family)